MGCSFLNVPLAGLNETTYKTVEPSNAVIMSGCGLQSKGYMFDSCRMGRPTIILNELI